ncbi:MAG: type II toxin-antitoxin system PemK/MazF family toxin [Bacteroidetes bacterium]|nr:type II toxin-antitoxin system PemK/MazF family toxin [Bacteroidota bacterium]
MARFIKGDIVVVPFPFSDLSGTKRRSAFVLANLPGSDIILCQATSRFKKDKFAVEISQIDFASGGLPILSYVRPNRIFTADKSIIVRKAGTLKSLVSESIISRVVSIIEN